MRRILMTSAILVLGLFLAFRFYHSPLKIKIGQTAPAFFLKDEQGKIVSLNQFKGKVVLLNFWATWCPACLSEMPSLEKLYQRFSGDGLVVLAINHDSENLKASKEAVSAFKKRVPLTFPILFDSDQSVFELYDISYLPVTYVIGRDGQVLDIISGAKDWTNFQFLKK